MTRAAIFACALLAACGGTSSSTGAPGDAGPVVDAAPQVDASASEAGSGGAFGAPCSANAQCASGVCLSVGRCSKPCDGRSDCPPAPEWQCAPTAGGGGRTYCACTPSGPEVCDGRDNDCDAIVDGPNATCAPTGTTCQGGQCVCPPMNQCGGGCVDTTTDRRNCGACDHKCGVVCTASMCRTVVEACATGYMTCVLTSDQIVRCTGDNARGELGDGTSTNRAVFAPNLAGPAARLACGAGGQTGCVQRTDGTVRCWGWPTVGNGSVGTVAIPVEIPSLAGARSLVLGKADACAVRADGSLACWGDNDQLQLGVATSDMCQPAPNPYSCSKQPVTVPGVTNIAGVALGAAHSCVLHTNGDVECWGSPRAGALGDGSTSMRGPNGVAVAHGVVQLAAGGDTTCAILSDRTVRCWGEGSSGQLGAPAPGGACGTNCSDTPLAVPGLTGVQELAMSAGHVCARLSDATVWCWGIDRAGEVGSAPTATCPQGDCVMAPTAVAGVSGATALAVGDGNSFAILADGTILGWGSDQYGTLGDGMTTSRTTPAPPVW